MRPCGVAVGAEVEAWLRKWGLLFALALASQEAFMTNEDRKV